MCSATNTTYPQDWPQIAYAIKERAGWRCIVCHHAHDRQAGYTLTVHHRDGNPMNNAPSNTLALCQRCHMIAAGIQARYGPRHAEQPTLFDQEGDTP